MHHDKAASSVVVNVYLAQMVIGQTDGFVSWKHETFGVS